MKKILILILIMSIPCFAQLKKEKSNSGFIGTIGFSGSVTSTKTGSPLKSTWLGSTVSATGGYIFNNNFSIRGEFNFSSFSKSFSKKDSNEIFNGLVLKGELLWGMFKPNEKINFYGIAGGGFYAFTQNEDKSLYASNKENNFGAVLGAGLSYRLSKKFSLNWEAQYNWIINNSNVNGYFNVSVINLAFTP